MGRSVIYLPGQLADAISAIMPFHNGLLSLLDFIAFVFAILETMVVLNLALYSVGKRWFLRRSLLPGTILAGVALLARILVPFPFHILVSIAALYLFVLILGKTGYVRALIGAVFSEMMVIMGSILIVEPIYILSEKRVSEFLVHNPVGFMIGTVLETIIPAVVLLVFAKYRLSLVGRVGEGAGRNASG